MQWQPNTSGAGLAAGGAASVSGPPPACATTPGSVGAALAAAPVPAHDATPVSGAAAPRTALAPARAWGDGPRNCKTSPVPERGREAAER